MGEDCKVAVRNIRRDSLDVFKKMKTAKEITEDEYTSYEKEVEDSTKNAISTVEKLQAEKEKEVLTV